MYLLNTQVAVPKHGIALRKRGQIAYCHQLISESSKKLPSGKLNENLLNSVPDYSREFPNEQYCALRGLEVPEPNYTLLKDGTFIICRILRRARTHTPALPSFPLRQLIISHGQALMICRQREVDKDHTA